MLISHSQYLRAAAEVSRLEDLVKSGRATPRDRERYATGKANVVAWEWGGNSPLSDLMPSVPMVVRDPRAVRFMDWWDRNEERLYADFWLDWFDHWCEPLNLSPEESLALYDEASAERWERVAWRMRNEPEGMVITDFENIPDGQAA